MERSMRVGHVFSVGRFFSVAGIQAVALSYVFV